MLQLALRVDLAESSGIGKGRHPTRPAFANPVIRRRPRLDAGIPENRRPVVWHLLGAHFDAERPASSTCGVTVAGRGRRYQRCYHR